MQNALQLRSPFSRSTLLFGCALLSLMLTGCGETAPHLDTTTVTSPLGQPGSCELCKKKIDKVTEQHLITIRGNQYIVCDEKCEADLKDWLSKQ